LTHPALNPFPTRRSSDLGPLETHPLVQPDAPRIGQRDDADRAAEALEHQAVEQRRVEAEANTPPVVIAVYVGRHLDRPLVGAARDRKSTRLNSSHVAISY